MLPLALLLSCGSDDKSDKDKDAPETVSKSEAVIQPSYRDLSVEEFAEYRFDPNAIVLDVRTEDEWKENGVIPDAVVIDWYDEAFAEKVSEISRDKSIYVYCHGGGRSAEAAEKLVEMGYSDVFNLENGFASWSYAKMPVDKKNE